MLVPERGWDYSSAWCWTVDKTFTVIGFTDILTSRLFLCRSILVERLSKWILTDKQEILGIK